VEVATWLNLQQANRVLDGVLDRAVQEAAGLSMAEYEVLFRLQVAGGGPLQMTQIATQLITSPSGTTRIADRLEDDGLITRETPRENRRVVEVTLTPHGKRVLDKAGTAFRQALRDAFSSHLSEREQATLRTLMRKLLEGNGAWSAARCSPGIKPPD
jgi:DNA-binding MarR family transcriptional regulator